MFIGEFHHTIDAKGRVILPAKFREQLQEKCVITRGIDQCLFLYPHHEWEKLLHKLNELPMNKKEVRQFIRFFLSGATVCEFDKQGRINLAAPLMAYAKLEKACVVIGVANRIELWNADTWDAYFEHTEEDMSAIVENIGFDL